MSAPVEFEYYSPPFTLEMLQNGIAPMRGKDGLLYGPAALRYRWRERVKLGEKGESLQWSPWVFVPNVNGSVDSGPG